MSDTVARAFRYLDRSLDAMRFAKCQLKSRVAEKKIAIQFFVRDGKALEAGDSAIPPPATRKSLFLGVQRK